MQGGLIMELMILNTDHISLQDQKEHTRQEFVEFMEATTKENKIEEFYDVIQVMCSQLFKEGIELEELQKGLNVHNDKLKSREWQIRGMMIL